MKFPYTAISLAPSTTKRWIHFPQSLVLHTLRNSNLFRTRYRHFVTTALYFVQLSGKRRKVHITRSALGLHCILEKASCSVSSTYTTSSKWLPSLGLIPTFKLEHNHSGRKGKPGRSRCVARRPGHEYYHIQPGKRKIPAGHVPSLSIQYAFGQL